MSFSPYSYLEINFKANKTSTLKLRLRSALTSSEVEMSEVEMSVAEMLKRALQLYERLIVNLWCGLYRNLKLRRNELGELATEHQQEISWRCIL